MNDTQKNKKLIEAIVKDYGFDIEDAIGEAFSEGAGHATFRFVRDGKTINVAFSIDPYNTTSIKEG